MIKNYKLQLFACLILSFSAFRMAAQPTYCTTQILYAYDDEIFNVTFGSLNNTTNCSSLGGSGSIMSCYNNYTGLTPPNVIQTNTYALSVTVGQCNYYAYGGYIGVWIDWNQDGSFTGTGEQVWMSGYNTWALAGTTINAPAITIPLTALPGVTRMRVIANEGSQPSPCSSSLYYGEVEDYNVNIISATPCTGTPGSNSVAGPTIPICPNSSVSLGLANSYTVGDITYQWQVATSQSVGPYTSITGATMSTYNTPSLSATTWYQVIITCTNSSQQITATLAQVDVSGIIYSTVPYYEGFEGIGAQNKLPNCSWTTNPLIGNGLYTYVSSNTQGRWARTGTKFASYFYTPTGNKSFYTNGIWMETGVTYSASVWYQTEYWGYTNWTNLSILAGPNQSATGQFTLANSNGPAVSSSYKPLSNTFTVPSTGYYYVAVRATASSGSAQYLSWDDLSIIVPCDLNPVPLNVSAPSATICAGQPISLTASGAHTYTWNTGAMGSSLNENPLASFVYNVVGTNTVTGCTATMNFPVTVNPSPQIGIFVDKPAICQGQAAVLTAFGAATYTWNTNSYNPSINVTPNTTTTYTVMASNQFGCVSTANQMVTVNPLPNVAGSANPASICAGEVTQLMGSGATSFMWSSQMGLINVNPVNVSPTSSTSYTLTGTNSNGCSNTAVVQLEVNACVGLSKHTAASGLSVYPNPTSGSFVVEFGSQAARSIEVVDLIGRTVYIANSSAERLSINASTLSSGVYYVKVKSGEQVDVVKVIKN